jgi:hypothetical protein
MLPPSHMSLRLLRGSCHLCCTDGVCVRVATRTADELCFADSRQVRLATVRMHNAALDVRAEHVADLRAHAVVQQQHGDALSATRSTTVPYTSCGCSPNAQSLR